VESKHLIKEKEINDSTAFAYLQKEIEKERKKTKTMSYIGASLLFTVAILGYLTFGPFQIPVLSQLGNTLLEGNSKEEKNTLLVEKIEEKDTESEEGVVAGEETEIVEEEIIEEKKPTAPTTTKKTTTSTTNNITPSPAPTPEPQPEVRQFACTEDTMQSYVNVMCTNFSFIGQSEAHLTPSARLESYNSCVSSDCYLISDYPDLLLQCQAKCLDWVEKEVASYESSIQEYNSNIQYYSNLLISCGWKMFEVDELKQTLLIQCVY
jgi:hypothetical protein